MSDKELVLKKIREAVKGGEEFMICRSEFEEYFKIPTENVRKSLYELADDSEIAFALMPLPGKDKVYTFVYVSDK